MPVSPGGWRQRRAGEQVVEWRQRDGQGSSWGSCMSHHDNLGSHLERDGQTLEESKERDGMAPWLTSLINKIIQSSMLTMGYRSQSGNRETSWEDLTKDHSSTDGDWTRMAAVGCGQILVCSEDSWWGWQMDWTEAERKRSRGCHKVLRT